MLISGRGEQSKGGRGAHSFGNPEQEAHEAEKDPASAAPDSEIVGGWGEGAAEEVPLNPYSLTLNLLNIPFNP
jgi:hypothetical protein